MIAKIEHSFTIEPVNKKYIQGFSSIIDEFVTRLNNDKELSNLQRKYLDLSHLNLLKENCLNVP